MAISTSHRRRPSLERGREDGKRAALVSPPGPLFSGRQWSLLKAQRNGPNPLLVERYLNQKAAWSVDLEGIQRYRRTETLRA
jgi:hypothetical protein